MQLSTNSQNEKFVRTSRVTQGEGSPSISGSESTLQALRSIEVTYRAFDTAEKVLTETIGVPICMSGCGKCCDVTTPLGWEFEARFLISYLMGSESENLSKILSICDGWLLERDGLSTFGWKNELSKDQQAKLSPEIDKVLLASPCPFLTVDKLCMVHKARFLICRAYGVTRMTSRICNRPLSPIEDQDTKAHIGPFGPVGNRVNRMINRSYREAAKLGWLGVQFMPTALFSITNPTKFAQYVDNNLVPTAKLVTMGVNPAIIFQDQLDSIWAMESKAMQVDISKEREETYV